MRQDVGKRNKIEILGTMLLPHPGEVFVKTVLSADFCAFWEVIDHLKFIESLVSGRFDIGTGPHDGPFLISIIYLPETIIFESVANQLNLDSIIHFEIQVFIRWFVRPNIHGIDIWPKEHGFLLKPTSDGLRHIGSVIVSFIQL